MSWIEVQFLDQASQALQQCRQVLKWTYAFAYYLARNNLTEIFEDNQKDLEMAVENLSEMFEKPIDQLQTLKVDMMDKTSYCTKRRIILLNDTAENLKAGTWEKPARPLRGYRQLSSWHCDHPVPLLADHPGMGPNFHDHC
jgi:ariadne-1